MVVIALTTVAAFAAVDGDARESGKDVGAQAGPRRRGGGGQRVPLRASTATTTTGRSARPCRRPTRSTTCGTGCRPTRASGRTVPGASTQYTIELLPANGYSKCTPGAKVADSMIDRRQPHAAHPRHRPRAERQGPVTTLGHRRAQARQLPGLPVVHRLRDQRPGLVLGALQRAPDRRPAGRPASTLGGQQLPRVLPLRRGTRQRELGRQVHRRQLVLSAAA